MKLEKKTNGKKSRMCQLFYADRRFSEFHQAQGQGRRPGKRECGNSSKKDGGFPALGGGYPSRPGGAL